MSLDVACAVFRSGILTANASGALTFLIPIGAEYLRMFDGTRSTTLTDGLAEARRVAIASAVGTTIEWYDFFIYGTAAAVVFAPQFFPQVSELAGTLAAFATFAIGFIARPLGGVVMGHFGDRLGRKSMLVWSLTLMGLATVAIGLLPNYSQIGLWAPALLIAFRFVQGFALGGE